MVAFTGIDLNVSISLFKTCTLTGLGLGLGLLIKITSQPRVELRNLHYINYYYTNFKIIGNYLHLKRFAHRRYKGFHSPISLKMFSIQKRVCDEG